MENLNMVESTEITATYIIINITYKRAQFFETEKYSNVIYIYIYMYLSIFIWGLQWHSS